MTVRLLPRSLFGRIALILFLGLAAAQVLTFLVVLRERSEASWTMMVGYLAKDVASAVAILDRLPPAERAEWLPRLDRRNYSYSLEPQQRRGGADPDLRMLASAVSAVLGPDRPVETASPMQLHVRLADGTPLSVVLAPPAMLISSWIFVVLAAQLALLGAAAWFAVRLVARPLTTLAVASDSLGPDLKAPVLPEGGPLEVAHAARAFNAMQRRIADHLTERTRILAAVSHDLQTPITRMRLRVDLLEDAALRDRLQGDLEAMRALVREGISYARSAEGIAEPPARVDLNALLDSLAHDYRDAGHSIRLSGKVAGPVSTRPHTLRRIVTNLVDNALKFAAEAEIEVTENEGGVRISVFDRGPGIDPGELEAVLQPFYRVEGSRSRDTGGTGLGLAIARQLASRLGGALTLANRPQGGLEARVTLPVL